MPNREILPFFISPVLSHLHWCVPVLCCADTALLWECVVIIPGQNMVICWTCRGWKDVSPSPLMSTYLDNFQPRSVQQTFLQSAYPNKLLAQWSKWKQQQVGESEFLQVVSYKPTVQISAQVQKQSEIIMKILFKVYIHIYCVWHTGLLTSNLNHNLNF